MSEPKTKIFKCLSAVFTYDEAGNYYISSHGIDQVKYKIAENVIEDKFDVLELSLDRWVICYKIGRYESQARSIVRTIGDVFVMGSCVYLPS